MKRAPKPRARRADTRDARQRNAETRDKSDRSTEPRGGSRARANDEHGAKHVHVGGAGRAASESGAVESGRPPWTVLRAELEAVRFRPSRRLGQNFLLDENMLRAIVRDARLPHDARVIEVGAGCGFLTFHLARSGARVTAFEIDDRLLAVAQRWLAQEPIRWVECDVLAGKHALHAELEDAIPASEPWHLVSNLPYGISAPLLALLAQHRSPPRSMTVLVQREVAERIVARPGTADWGPLSIRVQLGYACALVRKLAPSLFWPKPEVESALVRMDLRAGALARDERESLDRLVTRLFQRRRQAIARVLAELGWGRERAETVLAELGIDARARAEDLEMPTLVALGRALARPT
jgi:16S rRNA (adenine1518-N6/adenine1519-N6)-dimethyltransferase